MPVEVIGVSANVMDAGNAVPPGETVYLPWAQLSTSQLSIVVRQRGTEDAAIGAPRHALRLTDPVLAAHDIARLAALAALAAPAALGRSVMSQLARLTLPGIAIGLAGVMLLGGTLRRFVFGVEPRSVIVLASVSLGMALIAVAATLPSALRAMRVDLRRSLGSG